MAANVGRTITVGWGTPPVEVEGLREKGIELNGEPIDISSDDDNGWRTLLAVPAENQVNISLSGVSKNRVLQTDWFAGTRVYPGARPQGSALPALVFNRIDGAPLYADDGEVGLAQARVQIDCWAATYTAAKQLARAVKASLSGFVGEAGGVDFPSILIDAERDLREGGSNAAEYLFRTSIDFIVWHRT